MSISDLAIEQMRHHLELDEEQMKIAAEEEKKRRRECQESFLQQRICRSLCSIDAVHLDDVMAHVHTYGLVAPEAAGIIQ